MQLVFATNNRHKLTEIQALLKNYHIKSLDDLGCTDDIPETAPTLEGNALLKARYIHKKYYIDCFADDTGLEVEALGGKPGVYSARYAGEQKRAEDNIEKVLNELKGNTTRKARFITVIALILKGKEYFFEGVIDGFISEHKKGEKGFGYDPIFVPKGYNKSFAEMSFEEKNACSHRAVAVRKLVEFLHHTPISFSI